MHVTPPHPFGLQYAPHLAAPDDDPVLSGGGGESIQRPVGFLLLIPGFQLAASGTDQPPGRIGSYQGDDPGAFGFCEPGLAPGTRAITEPVYPLGVEAVDAFAYRLRMTSQMGSDLRGAQSAPAEHDHPGAQYPISGSVR